MPTKNNSDIFSGWWEIWCVVHDHGHPEQDIFENFHATQKKYEKVWRQMWKKVKRQQYMGGKNPKHLCYMKYLKFIQNQKHFDIKKTSINDINLNTNQPKKKKSIQTKPSDIIFSCLQVGTQAA